MSIKASQWAKARPIPANEKAVLRAMADYVRDGERLCYASQVRLAADLSRSTKHVRLMQDGLKARGLIDPKGKRGRSRCYRLCIDGEAQPRPEVDVHLEPGPVVPAWKGENCAGETGNPRPGIGNNFPLSESLKELEREPEHGDGLPGLAEMRRVYPRAASSLPVLEAAWTRALARTGGDPKPILTGLHRQRLWLNQLAHRDVGNRCFGPARWLDEQRWLDGADTQVSAGAASATRPATRESQQIDWLERKLKEGMGFRSAWTLVGKQGWLYTAEKELRRRYAAQIAEAGL